MPSVLQDWVMELPGREQGTLLTAVRGCDLAPKATLDSMERHLTAYIRWCFMVPPDEREVDYAPGSFYRSTPPPDFRASNLMHYPAHFLTHVMHALEVIAYRHPNKDICKDAYGLYIDIVSGMHLQPETMAQMVQRLSEDRIAKGNVIS